MSDTPPTGEQQAAPSLLVAITLEASGSVGRGPGGEPTPAELEADEQDEE